MLISFSGSDGLFEECESSRPRRGIGEVQLFAAGSAYEIAQDCVITLVILVGGDREIGLGNRVRGGG